ncbi:MAG: ABC transporter ATP-binding protein [Hungatella sp.]|nr:ABC transporter ATP-binding protein [Hungatella sp.]
MSDVRDNTTLIEVKNLKKYYKINSKATLHAVDDVSFQIGCGETMGLVGESGCGKSTIGSVMMRLQKQTAGEVLLEGRNIFDIKGSKEDMDVRRKMQIVFQDPYSSLNPRKRIKSILAESYETLNLCSRSQLEECLEMLCDKVGISKDMWMQFPHELDGGKRQIVGIARALSVNPRFIVCDEPVSALDVSVQAKILNLLMTLQKEMNISYLFISHDLSVVKHISHKIAVMYLGRIVELADKEALFVNTLHPYSLALLSAIPQVDMDNKVHRIVLKGDVVSPINPKQQCRFAPRCWMSQPICFEKEPELCEAEPGHCVACHFARESRKNAQNAEVISLDNK